MEATRPPGLTRPLEAILHQAFAHAIAMVDGARGAFDRPGPRTLVPLLKAVAGLRERAGSLTAAIVAGPAGLPVAPPAARALLVLPMHLERMADRGEALGMVLEGLGSADLPFTDRARSEVLALMDDTSDVLSALRDLVRTWNPVLARHVVHAADRAETRTDECAQEHRDRLVGGLCVPRSSPVYLALLDHLSSIRRHAREMALDLDRDRGSF